MSVLISKSTINKLNHNIREIRLKAFEEVATKLREGIINGEEVICSSVDLYNALISALHDTKNSQSDVLDILLNLFNSNHATTLIKTIGASKIRRDTQNAIRIVLDSNMELRPRINQFMKTLTKFETDNLTKSFEKKLSFKAAPSLLKLDLPLSDYVKRWSKPHISDLEEMQSLQLSLLDRRNGASMDHALNFIQGSVKNLPAEFFLQPPYLYKNLFECMLLEDYERSVLEILLDLTKSLGARMKIRTLTRTSEILLDDNDFPECQVSVPAYCYHLMMTIMTALKEIEDHSSQERLNFYFELMNSVVNLLKSSQGQYENQAILREMTFFAKFYREQYQNTKENYRFRVNYLVMLQLIAVLASCEAKDDGVVVKNDDHEERLPIWRQELEMSLMDFSFREAMPDVYEHIFKLCKAQENLQLVNMVHAAEILSPAVQILRCPDKFNDEELIFNGLEALKTLKLHKSEGLVRKLISAIINCAPLFSGNTELRHHGELLFLNLIATNIPRLKLVSYRLAIDAVKTFFAQVSDGTAGVLRMYDTEETGSRYMGIPLNSNILTELISFGMTNDNTEIQKGAEMILTYIVKGKPLLGKHWNKYFEILLPLLPLLQAVAPISSTLGHGIALLMDPDFELPIIECIHGNMRYLFTQESQAREDACLRLLFLTSNHSQATHYLPNIDNIKDTITNTFCIIRRRLPLRNPMKTGAFDVQSMRDLIEILKCQDSTPKVRFSTLIQLNAFVDDPGLCDVLVQQNAWPYILQAFDNAMKVNHNRDYPDSAVPAVQIICKLCVRSPEIRRVIAEDEDFNLLLLRAMFMYYHDDHFRFDAATLIFLLAFCDFVIGEDDLSLPQVLSNLFIPFHCEFHDKVSPFDAPNVLESMFHEDEEPFEDIVIVIDEQTSPKSQKIPTRVTDQPMYEQWQYLRMTFTTLWFDGLDFVLGNLDKTRSSSRKHGIVDYTVLPEHLRTTDTLDFDPRLELLESDINLIKITSIGEIVQHHIYRIENATNHREAASGICGIGSVIFLPHYQEHHAREFTKVIKKFVVTSPKTDDDELLFKLVVDILERYIRIGYETILVWVLKQLNDHQSIFIRLLYDKSVSPSLYNKNVTLIKTALKFFCCSESPDIKNLLQNDDQSLIMRIFEIISDELVKCDKDRVQSLLSLLNVITEYAKLDTDETLLNKVIAQLFYCLKVMKSLTHSGSFIAKNCLFSIGNIMKYVKDPSLDPNLIRLLQALCGHSDFIVRACAWSIFSTIAASLQGAKQIVSELASLPGGLHACIIQTMLDVEEVSLVKGTAATLFVNLLSHTGQVGLRPEVWPQCKESLKDYEKKDGFSLIAEILRKQQFLTRVREALDCFSPSIYVDPEGEMQMMTSPDTVIHLANILISVSELRPKRALTEGEKLTLESFLRCTYTIVPLNIGSTTLAMVTSICNLLSRYLSQDTSILAVILHHSWFMVNILKLLNLSYYETQEMCEKMCVNMLNLIQSVAVLPEGYEHICVSMEQVNMNNVMPFFNMCLLVNLNSPLLIAAMNCLRVLTMKGDQELLNSTPFCNILDTNTIEDPLLRGESEEELGLRPASEVLTKRLIQIFEKVCQQDTPKSGVFHISSLKLSCYNCLQALLRHTEHAGHVATSMGLFEKVLNRLRMIHENIGMSSREFIHKFGDRKKKPITQELALLAGLVSNWYCRVPMSDAESIEQLLKCLSNVWDWTSLDSNLLQNCLMMLMVLSEKSLIVCRALATFQTYNQMTFIRRVTEIAKSDTHKPKGQKVSFSRLRVAVRILTNCCSCIEGRIQLQKINVLEIIDTLHPDNNKKNKNLRHIASIWLDFYEILSRYPEGATANHLSVLFAFGRKQMPGVRLTAMKILRNMAFYSTNRSNLLTSNDYLHLVKEIIDSGNEKERVIFITSLWKLVANSSKHKNEIKNSAIYKKLNDLSNGLAVKHKTDTIVFEVLSCLLDVLNSDC